MGYLLLDFPRMNLYDLTSSFHHTTALYTLIVLIISVIKGTIYTISLYNNFFLYNTFITHQTGPPLSFDTSVRASILQIETQLKIHNVITTLYFQSNWNISFYVRQIKCHSFSSLRFIQAKLAYDKIARKNNETETFFKGWIRLTNI